MSSFFSFIVVLGVLIFFHELGHFLLARLFGVGVEKFSLGFGPRIYGRTVGITDYRLSAIPLGGYVKMIGEEPGSKIAPFEIPLSFTHKPVYQRFAIVAAGPVFNFLLAILIYYLIFQFSGLTLYYPKVGDVLEDSPAFQSGFQLGDLILAIDDIPVEGWGDLQDRIGDSEGRKMSFTVKRGDRQLIIETTPRLEPYTDFFGEEKDGYAIGLRLYKAPVIKDMAEGMAAQKAGFKNGDIIQSIDGVPVKTWDKLAEVITQSEGRVLEVKAIRGGDEVTLHLQPELLEVKDHLGRKSKHYRVGIASPSPEFYKKKLNPFEAASEGVARAYHLSGFILISMQKLIAGKISAKETLGGPILIAQTAGQMAKEGLTALLQFTAFISISLAILNFMPIPVLDGGHLLFFTIEAIRGRPVSEKVREISQQAGMAVLLILMIFVFYNDILRIITTKN